MSDLRSAPDLAPIATEPTAGHALAHLIGRAVFADRLGNHRFWFAGHHNSAGLARAVPKTTIVTFAGRPLLTRVASAGGMLTNHSLTRIAEGLAHDCFVLHWTDQGETVLGSSVKAGRAESTGVGPSLTPLPAGAIAVAGPPERHHAGRSGRSTYQRARPGRLSPEERETIRASAPKGTLRELAAEFGVSHETIRAVLRRME